MRRDIIPYNPKLKELARRLRKNMTFSEVKLWNELKNGKMLAYDFDRQRPIGNYIVDFYCKDLKLAIEVDGITHEDEKVMMKDKVKQEDLEILGVNFLRFDALLVVNEIEAVVREIGNWIDDYEQRHGMSDFVKRKRLKQANPPLPLRGGDATAQSQLSGDAL